MMTSTDAERRLDLDALRSTINRKIERYLPDPASTQPPLAEAMHYTLAAGGKRLRPLVVCASHRATGGVPDEDLWRTTTAVECLHTFSLVHDDLPCMDDDDYRRGLPTAHKKYGEGMAVLAGDALAILAFALLADTGRPLLVREFASAIGSAGMIGGQVADLAAEGTDATLDQVRNIHRLKTAALFRACARAGGILTGAGETQLTLLGRYGEQLGIAFQIKDDLLDIEGNRRSMGKTPGSDQRKHKATYPGASSIERARADMSAAMMRAREALAPLVDRESLERILEMAIKREG